MRVLVLFVLAMISFPGYSAVYYVDSRSGSDNNSGSSESTAWKTLARVRLAYFRPGDKILLRRGSIWREKLVVSSSGVKGYPVTYASYGSGRNPIIMTTQLYSQWELAQTSGTAKIWVGRIPGIKTHWGAMRSGRRVPMYFGYSTLGNEYQKKYTAPTSLLSMKPGFFYAPLGQGIFYYRNDSGNPGSMEIGVRNEAILIKNRRYVVIDGIDAIGPGGDTSNVGATGTGIILITGSSNITITNSVVSHGHNSGIRIDAGSRNNTILKVKSYGHRSTGIYLWEAGEGNRVVNAEVYNCGLLESDTGDMGLIGVWKTPGTLLQANYVHNNGHSNVRKIDAAISVVRGAGTLVFGNIVENTGGTGILVASDSDNSKVLYNIVRGWGAYAPTIEEKNHSEGIRIGGGVRESTVRNVIVGHNLITASRSVGHKRSGLLITDHESDGLVVNNNIFYFNGDNYDLSAFSRKKSPLWQFSRNIIFKRGVPSIRISGRIYSGLQINSILSAKSGGRESGWSAKIVDPKVDLDAYQLLPDSPAIDSASNILSGRDIHGNIIPQGSRADIGPFEYTKSITQKPANTTTSSGAVRIDRNAANRGTGSVSSGRSGSGDQMGF